MKPLTIVRDLMIDPVTTLDGSATVEHAVQEMDLSKVRHLPILDREGRLAGLLSDRDLSRARDPHAKVRGLMTTDVLTVGPETPLTEAAFLLLQRRIGSLPVCDEHGKLVGILTETDFVRLAYGMLGGPDLEDRLSEEHEAERL